jgi:hypothetical protein
VSVRRLNPEGPRTPNGSGCRTPKPSRIIATLAEQNRPC